MLIVAGRPWANRVFAQQRVQRFPVQVGEFIQKGLGFGRGGENAPHGSQREGAEANGPLESGTHIVPLIVGDQGQQLLGLQLALNLLLQQAVEELQGDRAEFAEALP